MTRAAVASALGVAAGAALLVVLAFLPVTMPLPETVTPLTDTTEQQRFAPTDSVMQEFPASGAGISAIGFFLSASQPVRGGTLLVTVMGKRGDQWTPLASREVDPTTLADNAFMVLPFTPPLAVAKGQPVRITLRFPVAPDTAIGWYLTPDWQPEGFALAVNGRPQSGTARFHVRYTGTPDRLWHTIGPLWKRLTIFLLPLWQVVLFCGIVLAVGGMAVALVRPLRD